MINNAKILLVDDDPTQIAILTAYLASLKVGEILDASDGAEAKRIIEEQQEPFDIIFTDLSMPNVDGFEMLKYLASIKYKGRVVIISGFERIVLESATSLGKLYGLSISGQVRKPLTKFALDRLVAEDTGLKAASTTVGKWEIKPDDILEALSKNQIIPYYQPKVELLSGRVVGAEALARWIHPEHGTISPGAFIAVAEKGGLMTQLTVSMFRSAMQDYRRNAEIWNGMKISLNLAPELLRNVDFPNQLEEMVNYYQIPVSAICIEITESGVIDFDPIVVEVLARLRIKGFDLSIDDFGTGAANIANLKTFPYSELKIDQSFINNVLTDAFSAETVRTSLSLARQLNLRTVAEGIETENVLQYMKAKGIDQAQGYLFSKAIPADQMTKMFASPMSWIAERKLENQTSAA